MSTSSSDWSSSDSDSSSSSSSDGFDSTSTSSRSFSDMEEDDAVVFSAVRIINRSSLRNNRTSRRVRETADTQSIPSMEVEDTDDEESTGPPKERCTICLMTYRQTDTLNSGPITRSRARAERATREARTRLSTLIRLAMNISSHDRTSSGSNSSSSSSPGEFDSTSTSSLPFSNMEGDAVEFSAVRIVNLSWLRNNQLSMRVRETADTQSTPSMEVEDTEDEESTGPPKERCTICLMTYRETDTIQQLSCGHVFHEGCVSRWLRGNNICPMCRTRIASAPMTMRRVQLFIETRQANHH